MGRFQTKTLTGSGFNWVASYKVNWLPTKRFWNPSPKQPKTRMPSSEPLGPLCLVGRLENDERFNRFCTQPLAAPLFRTFSYPEGGAKSKRVSLFEGTPFVGLKGAKRKHHTFWGVQPEKRHTQKGRKRTLPRRSIRPASLSLSWPKSSRAKACCSRNGRRPAGWAVLEIPN